MKFDKIVDKILKEASYDSYGHRLGRGGDEYPTRRKEHAPIGMKPERFSILKDGQVIESGLVHMDALKAKYKMEKEHPGANIEIKQTMDESWSGEKTVGETETWDITDLSSGKVVHSCGSKEDCYDWCKKQPKSKQFSFRKIKS